MKERIQKSNQIKEQENVLMEANGQPYQSTQADLKEKAQKANALAYLQNTVAHLKQVDHQQKVGHSRESGNWFGPSNFMGRT